MNEESDEHADGALSWADAADVAAPWGGGAATKRAVVARGVDTADAAAAGVAALARAANDAIMAEFGGQLGGDLTGVRLGGAVAAAADAGGADAAGGAVAAAAADAGGADAAG